MEMERFKRQSTHKSLLDVVYNLSAEAKDSFLVKDYHAVYRKAEKTRVVRYPMLQKKSQAMCMLVWKTIDLPSASGQTDRNSKSYV